MIKIPASYIVFIPIVFLFACKKDQGTSPPIARSKVTLNLDFQANAQNNKWELVISQSNGEIVLDTLANANSTSTFEFFTNEKYLDLTFIYYNVSDGKFVAGSFRGVDPRSWDKLEMPVFGHLNATKPNSQAPSTRAKVYYINPPANAGSLFFYPNNFTLIAYNSTNITVDYARRKDIPAYLLLPDRGLYKLQIPRSDNDTIDLSRMDNAIRTPFDFKASQIGSYALLYGVMDTTDRSKDLQLYNFNIDARRTELLYPRESFPKYELLVGANSTANEFFALYSYDDTIPKTYHLLTNADYSLKSANTNDFRIVFTGTPPLYYLTKWENNSLEWNVYSPVSNSQFNATAMLDKMKKKLLQGINTKDIRLNQLILERSGNSDYAKLLTKAMVSSEKNKTPDYLTVMYVKTF